MEIISLVGLSGSGKTTALHVLGDEGYLILDSLSAETIGPIVEILSNDLATQKVVIVLDFYSKEEFNRKYEALDVVCKKLELPFTKYFIKSDRDVIISRYKELRRLHPLIITKSEDSVESSVNLEVKITKLYASIADYTFDTTNTSVIEYRRLLMASLDKQSKFSINVMSFGFKHGSVSEADFIFDLRFLPNPFYIQELREQTGLQDCVYDYVFSFDDANLFYESVLNLIKIALRNFEREGRVVTTIAFGCTGGRHRSVSFARRLGNELTQNYDVNIIHREQKKD